MWGEKHLFWDLTNVLKNVHWFYTLNVFVLFYDAVGYVGLKNHDTLAFETITFQEVNRNGSHFEFRW